MKNNNINKVIVIDWSVFLKMATNASGNCGMEPTFIAMTMILGNLKKIGVEPDDLILIACDGRNNWRKEYLPETKGDRKETESKFQKRFPNIYEKFNALLDKLDVATDWHIVHDSKLEADDWMSCACRFYGVFFDKPVVLLTIDGDMSQLWKYDNVKWFSPHRSIRRYKIKPENFNIHKLLSKVILTKGHNNLGIPENDEEYKIKKLCCDLTKLPEWVEHICIKKFMEIEPKEFNPQLLGSPTLIERFNELFNDKSKIITYEKSVKVVERKKKKLKKQKEIQNGKQC